VCVGLRYILWPISHQVCGKCQHQGRKIAVPLRLHSQLNTLMDTIQVVKELRQITWTMGPDDERVINVANTSERLVGRPLQSRFLKVLHEEIGDNRE
jgi:hypothetical protein